MPTFPAIPEAPDTSRAFAILANSRPAGSLLVPVASGNDGTSPNHRKPRHTASLCHPRQQTAHRLPMTSLPGLATFGDAMTAKPEQISGLQQPCRRTAHRRSSGSLPTSITFRSRRQPASPGVQTNHELQPTSPAGGPPARCLLRPRRQFATPTARHTSGRRHLHHQTVFGRTAPNLSTADAPQPVAATAAAAAIAATLRQIRGPFPDKTHLSRHDKQAY